MSVKPSLCVLVWLLLGPVSQADTEIGDTVYVVRRGWHIDLGFDTSELVAPLRSAAREFVGARYVLFGFGDRRYLMAKHSHVPAMVGALWPGRALILATGLSATPAEAFGAKSVVKLDISRTQSQELQDFIAQSLHEADMGAGGGPGFVAAAPGPYGGSLYFNSDLRYSALYTCNTWAAEGLQAAQLPVRSRGTVLASQLWRQVGRLAPPYQAHEGAGP